MRPLLAHTIEDTSKIKYPVLVSQKLDGIRCLIIDGVAMYRSLKPIKNKYIQSILGKSEYNGLDGELVVGEKCHPNSLDHTTSGANSRDGEPDFCYYLFDKWDDERGFADRYASLMKYDGCERISVIPHKWAYSETDLLYIERRYLEVGAEGIIVRKIDGHYKNGRSTAKEGFLGRWKRYHEEEFDVIGFEERMHNENEATINELGYTERSSHKENKSGRGDLGAIVLRTKEGVVFKCGTGFDDELRRHIWCNQSNYIDGLVKLRFPRMGINGVPMQSVFVGFRSREDL
ncbi:MAG TPA: hypothetical protein P5317_11055 [Myxococcota bacterium]|jgi:DNA ligase-1|nr:hypothetical protein [Myxococcota bacterium]HRV18532.1 hypothetical protein [Myxococcota bacterium]